MTDEWKKLYDAAKSVIRPVDISGDMSVGGVGAAVESSKGNIYLGICIDTSCSLGMCAERNAISTMFTSGEYEISRVIAVGCNGNIMPPCGACREFMMQTGKNARDIEIMLPEERIVKLGDLMPDYWS